MDTQWFKRSKPGWERPFILPRAPVGHAIFGVFLAVILVNIRITLARQGLAGIPVDLVVGVFSFGVTSILLNILPEKFVLDEGEK